MLCARRVVAVCRVPRLPQQPQRRLPLAAPHLVVCDISRPQRISPQAMSLPLFV